MRRPISRIAIRISCTTRMLLVLVRSRPGNQAAEQAMAAANWPCVAGSPSTIASSSALAAARSAARSA